MQEGSSKKSKNRKSKKVKKKNLTKKIEENNLHSESTNKTALKTFQEVSASKSSEKIPNDKIEESKEDTGVGSKNSDFEKEQSSEQTIKPETKASKILTELESNETPSISKLYKRKKQLRDFNLTTLTYNKSDILNNFTLNKERPVIQRKKRRELKGLNLQTRAKPIIRINKNLNKDYSKEILDKLVNLIEYRSKREKDQFNGVKAEKIKTQNLKEIENPAQKEGKSSESEAESIFRKFLKSRGLKFPSEIDSENPYIIFLPTSTNDKFIDTLWIILREIFRKLTKKGKPISDYIDKKEDLEIETEAEDKITIIEEQNNELIFCPKRGISTATEAKKKVNVELLINRLKQLKTQELGFIVFHISEKKFEEIENIIKEKKGWIPNIIKLEPQLIYHQKVKNNKIIDAEKLQLIAEITEEESNKVELEFKEYSKIKKKITSLFWGLIEPIDDEYNRWGDDNTFDDYFSACELMYWNVLKKIYKKASVNINGVKTTLYYDDHVKFHPTAKLLHKSMKILAIKHLIEKKNKTWDEIKVEEKNYNESKIKPDILVNGNEPFEIETFYGRGDPEDRINSLIKRYKSSNEFSNLVIIITNLDAILWYKEFHNLKKENRNEIDIEFKTLDLKNKKLIDISELKSRFLNNIKELN